MKLIRNRQLASVLQALIVSLLLLVPARSLALEALSSEELNALQKVRESESALLQESVGQQSELDSTEIAAIKTITAARKQKRSIERRGMTPSPELQHASKALQKKVSPNSKTSTDLLQLDVQLQLDGQDNQPIIELVVSDFGGPPPHKRLHRTDGKHKKHHKHHHKSEEESNSDAVEKKKSPEEGEGEGDVESKQFDADDLDAYTSNAINNHFNDVKRKGFGSHKDTDKKGAIDLSKSLNEVAAKPSPQPQQSLTQSTKKSEAGEDSVDRAFSEPSVQQDTPNAEQASTQQAPVAPQKLSQDSEKVSQPTQQKQQVEEKAPSSQAEEKTPSQAEEKTTSKAEEKAPSQAEEKTTPKAEEKASSPAEEKTTTKADETQQDKPQKSEPKKPEKLSQSNDNDNSASSPVAVSSAVDPNEEINAYSNYLNSAADKQSKPESSSNSFDSSQVESQNSLAEQPRPSDGQMSLTQSVEQSQKRAAASAETSTDQEANKKSEGHSHSHGSSQSAEDDSDDLDEHYSFESLVSLRNEQTNPQH